MRKRGADPQPPLVAMSIDQQPLDQQLPDRQLPDRQLLDQQLLDRPLRPGGRLSVGARIGLVLAAVALFALGVVMGRGTIITQFGTALPAPVPTTTTTTVAPTSSAASTTSFAVPSTESADSSAPPSTFETATGRDDQPAWPSTTGSCGSETPKPIIDGAETLRGGIDGAVVTGGSPARVDLATGTVGQPLLALNDSEYLAGLAADTASVVAIAAPCDGRGPWRVMRVAANGKTTVITLPDEDTRPGLIGGGDRVWVTLLPPGAYGGMSLSLIAADDPTDTITLPQGLIPMKGRGSTIVGQFLSDGNAPSALFGVVDAETGEMLTRFGDWDAAASGEVKNAVVSGDFILAAPWACEGTCTLRRYNLETGEEYTVDLDPPVERILAGGVAIRPDGGAAAVNLLEQPPSPAPFDPNPLPSTGPSGTVRVGIIDLDTGEVRALPGITLGPLQPADLAFTQDGNWLVVAVNEGDATRLLLYTADGDGPYDPGISVPGPTLWPVLAPVTGA